MLMDSSLFLVTVAAAILIGFFFSVYKRFRLHPQNKDLDSSSSLPPSSSSSSSLTISSRKWTHDVFPSFRGEDVRRNFLSHVHKEFRRKGITAFIDNDIKRGEFIGPELIQAIRSSKVAVVLLSRNYASSKWCLDELVEIMKCKEELGQMVFVIFYEVDPSDVKKLTGDFGAVFKKTCAGKTKEDIGRWRQALAKVATIAGFDSRNWDNEAVMIEDIVSKISKWLINSSPSSDFEGLIGMGRHFENMKLLLCLGSDKVRIIGIWGPPGIGKTTIARFTYGQISCGFEMSVFMKPSYSRPTCSDDHDVKLHFEQQLLSQLTNQKDLEISHLGAAQNFLRDKKVLVVLDGVDQVIQLLAMPKAQCLGPGTRIIITTQNQQLLKAIGIEHIYKVELPPNDEALQILCMSAFDQKSPYDGFEDLVREVIRLAGSLPFGLKVMGSYLRGMSKEEWEEELPRLRIYLDGKIGSILKFSYDALEEEDKSLFLYIACFFNSIDDLNDGTLEDILRHRFPNVRRGLKVLVQRSLVSSENYYSMHNLLVQMGRDIVRKQSINDPGKRQFLVEAKEIVDIFTHNTGSRSVLGIDFKSSMTEDYFDTSERAFEEMHDLQFFRFRYRRGWRPLPQGLTYLPPKLRVLIWYDHPLTCLPSTFNPTFLVKIVLTYSKLEKLWEGIQPLRNLKLINLRASVNLKELPDLSTATNLEKMYLSYCSSLVELPPSIGNLINLQELHLQECSSLVKLPFSIGNLTNLSILDLQGCINVVELPSSIGNLTNLQKLNHGYYSKFRASKFTQLDYGSPRILKLPSSVELPSSIGNLINLQRLVFTDCSSMVELPSSVGNLTNLQKLVLDGCSSLVKIPSSIGNLQMLKSLSLRKCLKLEVLPININLGSLEKLEVTGCSQLRSFPKISTNIEKLRLLGTLINEVPLLIKSCSRLRYLEIPYCKNLGEFPNVLNIIRVLEFNNTDIEELPPWVSGCYRLEKLLLKNCKKLVSISHLPGPLNIVAENCDSLKGFACCALNFVYYSLHFVNCWQLNEEARNIIIKKSLHPYTAILPGSEMPAFFTFKATSGIVKLNQRCLPKYYRYKVCISLADKGEEGACDEKYARVLCRVWFKPNDPDTYKERAIYDLHPLLTDHLYTFHVGKYVESSEVFFEFKLESEIEKWEIAECRVCLLKE